MKTATQIKSDRIKETTDLQAETIRKSLRRLRDRVINCEDDTMTERLHKQITMKKLELFQLTEKCVEEFTISFTKVGEDYFASAKYQYEERQAMIHKEAGYYWSSDMQGTKRYLKDVKVIITENLKRELGA